VRYALATFTILVLGGLLLVGGVRALPARALPAAAAAISTEATGTPAPLYIVNQACRAQRGAILAFRAYARAAACFGGHPVLHLARRPARAASYGAWMDSWEGYAAQRRHFTEMLGKLRHRMTHPGGSGGARWRPLALWVGWPPSAWPTVLYVMALRGGHGESGGDPNAVNHLPPYCRGLLQLARGWWTGAWGPPAGNPFDPEYNLRTGLWIWRHQGWAPWSM